MNETLRVVPNSSSPEIFFSYVYKNYYGYIRKFLTFLSEDAFATPDKTEDLAEDFFAKLWPHSSSYDPSKSSLLTWLKQIAINHSVDTKRYHYRKMRALSQKESSLDELVETDSLPNLQQSFTEDLIMSIEVQNALKQLPSDQRQVIEGFFFDDLTDLQLAERFNVSTGTIKTRRRLACIKLRILLSDYN